MLKTHKIRTQSRKQDILQIIALTILLLLMVLVFEVRERGRQQEHTSTSAPAKSYKVTANTLF